MKTLTTALLALTLAACGAATSAIADSDLAITARDAYLEARTEARSWSPNARLRYVEGLNIAASGTAFQGTGEWRFHYTAAGTAGELQVRVTPLEMSTEERPATSPPGYVIGDNALGESWVDSPAVLEAVLRARQDPAAAGLMAELLLAPTSPARWVVRFPSEGSTRWTVNAETGTLIQGGE
ncbi:MAG TPA: hypothetical protein VMM12_14810 [Longimicrobiales bacterium]|nr:hypothetical protein [Longimicrobiales bacterium]